MNGKGRVVSIDAQHTEEGVGDQGYLIRGKAGTMWREGVRRRRAGREFYMANRFHPPKRTNPPPPPPQKNQQTPQKPRVFAATVIDGIRKGFLSEKVNKRRGTVLLQNLGRRGMDEKKKRLS